MRIELTTREFLDLVEVLIDAMNDEEEVGTEPRRRGITVPIRVVKTDEGPDDGI